MGRKEVRQLIKRIIDSGIESLMPELTAGEYRYPFAEEALNSDSTDTVNVLEALSKMGVLEKQLHESIMACPGCGHGCLTVKLVCPTCSSGQMLKGNVVEHLLCGYVDLEQRFRDKGFVCPKCEKKLTAAGVDYRPAGLFYKCFSCGRVTASPVKRYVCAKCMKASSEDELASKPVNRYVVVYDKLKSYGAFVDVSPIILYLESKNYVVKHPAQIAGYSGITHEFTLFVSKQGTSPPSGVVVDVVAGVQESKVYELFTKSFDVKAGGTMLFVLGKADQKAVRVAKTFSIDVFEADTVEELLDKVRQPLENAIDSLSKRQADRLRQDPGQHSA